MKETKEKAANAGAVPEEVAKFVEMAFGKSRRPMTAEESADAHIETEADRAADEGESEGWTIVENVDGLPSGSFGAGSAREALAKIGEKVDETFERGAARGSWAFVNVTDEDGKIVFWEAKKK